MPWLPQLFSAPALQQVLDRIYDDADPPLGLHAETPAG
jgi:hypothetical protein